MQAQPDPEPKALRIDAMQAALARCTSPAAVRSILERLLARLFERAVALQVKGGAVILPDGRALDPVPTTLAVAIRTRAHNLSVWPDDGAHQALRDALGCAASRTSLVLPVSVDERVVLVATCDNGERDIAATSVATALQIALATGEALGELIRRRKADDETGTAPRLKVASEPWLPIEPTAAPLTWADVVAETRVAASIEPPATAPRAAALLDALDAARPEEVDAFIGRLLELDDGIDDEIKKRFPGALTLDPLDPRQTVPPLAQCSRLLALLAARGTGAAAVVVPHLQSQEPAQRFAAVYFLMSYPYGPALRLLAGRLYDTEPRIRYLAADALRAHAHEPDYEQVVAAIREQLKIPIAAAQLSAVQLLGQLRDPGSAAGLMALLNAHDAALRKAAQSSLTVICARVDGDAQGWLAWWKSNRQRHRVEWLIAGLHDARAAIRELADYELQLYSGIRTGFAAEAGEAVRAQAIARWEQWWNAQRRTVHIL